MEIPRDSFYSGNYFDFDKIPENMTYTLWIEKYAFEPPHEFEDYREDVIRKIRPKLEQLELKGFKFVEEVVGEGGRRN